MWFNYIVTSSNSSIILVISIVVISGLATIAITLLLYYLVLQLQCKVEHSTLLITNTILKVKYLHTLLPYCSTDTHNVLSPPDTCTLVLSSGLTVKY